MTQRSLEEHGVHVQQYLGDMLRGHSSNAMSQEQEDSKMGNQEEI
jgi:hypothetical protein